MQTNQWAYERRYAEGIAGLQAAAARPDLATTEYDKIFIESNLAWFQQLAGEAAAACSTWQHVRTGIEALRRNKGEEFGFLELASASIALGCRAGRRERFGHSAISDLCPGPDRSQLRRSQTKSAVGSIARRSALRKNRRLAGAEADG